jgi:hypothetical protein
MKNRYRIPPAPAPSLAELHLLLAEANPTLRQINEDVEGCEKRRIEAVGKLLSLARDSVTKANEKAPHPPPGYSRLRAMPPELRDFLEINGLLILLAEDQTAKLQQFLGKGGPRAKGRPRANNERRNILVAAAVANLVDGGTRAEAAFRQIGTDNGLSWEMVREIYYAHRDSEYVMLEAVMRGASPR